MHALMHDRDTGISDTKRAPARRFINRSFESVGSLCRFVARPGTARPLPRVTGGRTCGPWNDQVRSVRSPRDGDQDAAAAAGVDTVVGLGDVRQLVAVADLDGQGAHG